MALSRKDSKHKRSLSYGGVFSSFLSTASPTVSVQEVKVEKVEKISSKCVSDSARVVGLPPTGDTDHTNDHLNVAMPPAHPGRKKASTLKSLAQRQASVPMDVILNKRTRSPHRAKSPSRLAHIHSSQGLTEALMRSSSTELNDGESLGQYAARTLAVGQSECTSEITG